MRPAPIREPELLPFMDDRELDPLRGLLVSSAIRGPVVKLHSVYIFEIDPNRYHKECASRTRFHRAFQQIATGRLRRHKREIPPCRIHSKSCSFLFFSWRSSYPSSFSNEFGMFIILDEVSNNQPFHCTSSGLMLTLQIANNTA